MYLKMIQMKYLFSSILIGFIFFTSNAALPFNELSSIVSRVSFQDTTKKSNCASPVFHLGFGQTIIPALEVFFNDPEIVDYVNHKMYVIKQYRITLLMPNGIYETSMNVGTKYSEQTHKMLQKSRPGDKVFVDEIEAYDENKEVVKIPSRSIYLR